MEFPYGISLAGISGSDTMSKNIASSEFYEFASGVKDEIVNSDDKPEIIVGGPQEELEQHKRRSHSKVEQYELDRDTFQIETPSIDIKYEVDYIEHNPTSDAEDHLDRVHSPSSLTSVVKSEPDIDRLEIHYFDHSSAIQRNLKTEPEDEDGNCEDPLSGADSMPLGQLAGTSIEVLGQYSSEMIQTGEESCFRRLSKQSNHGEGESEREKSFFAASRPNKDKIDRTADKKMRYKCENCEKTFVYRSLLTIHAMCHSGEKPFKCDTCGKSFAQTSHLTRHKICHSGVKPFECDACGKYYARKESLIEHMMTHNAEHPFMCETCGKSFATKRSLTDHRTIHTGMQPFKCDICGLGITTKANFTVHMRTHNGENPFKCETCGRSFALKTSLIGHMRTHTGDKPFQCDTCGRSFAREKSLAEHMRTHTREKPFECETCGKSFGTKRLLINHVRTHTGEKPFKCETCGKCFAVQSNLTDHMRTHRTDKLFQCKTCGKSFLLKRYLADHVRQHTVVTPFRCEPCQKYFPNNLTLIRHKCTINK